MSDLLRIEGLRYAYGDRVAVRDADLAVRRGEIFGLLGPNGAGKTTLLSCVAGLLANFGGTLWLDNAPFVPAADGAQRARLGLVPQEVALYDDLTGRENLVFFGGLQGLPKHELAAAAQQALALAGLEERADDKVADYSGGMKRRLNLVAGDLHGPDLLLLDEPTVGVDPQSRNHLFDSLRALRDRGRTLIYTSHSMDEVQRLCDRVGVMNDGAVVAIGTHAELAAAAGIPGADLETVFLKLTGRALRDEA